MKGPPRVVKMANYDNPKSTHQTLTAGNEDIVKLTQFWDAIEIENRDATTVPLYVSFSGTATVGGAGTSVIAAGSSKMFKAGIYRAGGVPGSTVTPCHQISIIGNGNAYSVDGVAGE